MSSTESEDLNKFNEITEGKATIFQPTSVFYNPVQEFNRDLTIAVISEFAKDHVKEVIAKRESKTAAVEKKVLDEKKEAGEEDNGVSVTTEEELKEGKQHPDGVKILEGLAASGLRSMRFGLEIPGVNKIITNDFDKTAVEVIEKNIEKNNLSDLVESSHGDAAMLMHRHKSFKDRFDVIDLDPYGSVAPFLDAAVQAVRDGGLLCVTSTDAAVLCGSAGEKCFTLYGSMSLRSKFCHEMGLRILLNAIQSHAARYSRYIVPVLSMSIDFYFRVFVRVYSGQYKAKFSAAKSGLVYHCIGCGSFIAQPLGLTLPAKGDNVKFTPAHAPPVKELCEHCGHKQQIGGPIYLAPMHDREFIERVIKRASMFPENFKTGKRIEGMLSMATEELDVPLYYEADALYKVVHCTPPTIMQIRSAILHAGYEVSFAHSCKNSLKTNAPNTVIWDIIRAWVAKRPVNSKRLVEGSPAAVILARQPSIEVCFGNHDNANPKSRSQGLLRWQSNPEKNWGPMPRAKHSGDGDTLEDRRMKNQGKRKRDQYKSEDSSSPPHKQKETEAGTGTQC